MPSPAHTNSAAHARGISFECESFPIHFAPVQAFDWCSVHHVKAGCQQHSIAMMREFHTWLIFDRGSYSDGWRNIDGVRLGQRGILGTGIDVIPAGATLKAWSGLKSDVGCTLISVNPLELEAVLGGDGQVPRFRPASNLGNELLVALASRISSWVAMEHDRGSSLQTETLLMLLAQELARVQEGNFMGGAHRGGLASRAQRLVREFIHEHMDASLDLETLAGIAGLSRFHFSRAFKASFGLSPHKYVQQERLRRACELMEHTDGSITDIALQAGFASSSELARSFKLLKGCSPRQYRSAVLGRAVRKSSGAALPASPTFS